MAALGGLGLLQLAAAAGPIGFNLHRRPGLGWRQLRRLGAAVNEAKLYGDITNYYVYHADVLIGTPEQLQSVIADTGSPMTAFPCTTCGASCGSHIDPPFDHDASSTFSWVQCADSRCPSCRDGQCRYSTRYVEGSMIAGRYFEDVLHLGAAPRQNRRAPVLLGCHEEETKHFKTQAPSGIMGLSEAAWDVLEAMTGGPIERQTLAICLSDDGGVLTFGGFNETWTPLLTEVQWAPYSYHYYVSVDAIRLVSAAGGSEVSQDLGDFMVDSGTTYTYFTRQQAQALRSAIEGSCGGGRCGGASSVDGCWYADGAAINSFPTLHFSIGPATVQWHPQGYLVQDGPGRWCYTFFGEPPLTLGASFMLNHLVVFDREDRKIGFAPSSCPSFWSRTDPAPGAEAFVGPTTTRFAGTAPPTTTEPGAQTSETSQAATSGSVVSRIAEAVLPSVLGLAAVFAYAA